jgi:antitoxin MazE
VHGKVPLPNAIETLGAKHRLTIPPQIIQALRLKKGDYMLMQLVGHKLELTPIPRDQLWFWTREWQKKEREVDREIARGNVRSFNSVAELLKELKRR